MATPVPDLSVVIPVHDAVDTLPDVVRTLLAAPRLAVEVVVVDDASTDGSTDVVRGLAADHDQVTAVVFDDNHGAGVARNAGFEHVRGRYTWFFDADDIPHVQELARIVVELDATGADVAFTPYHYRRGVDAPGSAMNAVDLRVWSDTMPAGLTFHVTTLTSDPRLLGFTNYPWNKLVRTSRARRTGLRFGTTSVNNDIMGHWHALLHARSILLADVELCTHVVQPGGANLTNRHSRARLELFAALHETYDLLASMPHLRHRFAHHWWSFVVRTTSWARGRIGDDLRPEFNLALHDLVLRIDLADLAGIRTKRDPELADSLLEAALR